MQAFLSSLLKKTQTQQTTLSLESFDVQGILTRNSSTQIMLANWKSSKDKIVVLKKQTRSASKTSLITAEVNAGKALNHSGIVKYHGEFSIESDSYIVLEYVEGTDLFEFLQSRQFKPVTEEFAQKIFKQVIRAVHYIHSKGFVHRDIKLDNIVLKKDGEAKVIDFGLSSEKDCQAFSSTFLGTVEYMCPEIVRRAPYQTCKAEAFALGMVLYSLLFGVFPYSETVRKTGYYLGELHFPSTVNVSDQAKDLLTKLLAIDSDKRIDVHEAKKHKWCS